MNQKRIKLLIDNLESSINLLKMELDEDILEETKLPDNTISLRELIGNIGNDDYEPDYVIED